MAARDARPLVSISQLTHKFGPVTALWRLNLLISAGDYLVIFGPNGAGKTTLLRLVAQLMRPTQGEINLSWGEGSTGRGRIGYVSHQSLLYNDLTGLENLVFFSRLYGLADPSQTAQVLIEKMSLRNARHQQVRTYSSGMRQRLSLARAMLHDPDLLLLDEPYSGLDQHGSRLLTQLLEQLRVAGKTVLLITHNLSEGLALSNRVVILNQGQVVFESSREDIDTAAFESLYFQHVES